MLFYQLTLFSLQLVQSQHVLSFQTTAIQKGPLLSYRISTETIKSNVSQASEISNFENFINPNSRLCLDTLHDYRLWTPIPVAARFRPWVCGRSLAGIVGSNLAGGMDVCPLWVLCVVRYRSLCWTDLSSREALTNVVCLSVITNPRQWACLGPLEAVTPW